MKEGITIYWCLLYTESLTWGSGLRAQFCCIGQADRGWGRESPWLCGEGDVLRSQVLELEPGFLTPTLLRSESGPRGVNSEQAWEICGWPQAEPPEPLGPEVLSSGSKKQLPRIRPQLEYLWSPPLPPLRPPLWFPEVGAGRKVSSLATTCPAGVTQ